MGMRSQSLLSSFVRVVIAANIFAFISLSGNLQNDITWAKNLDTKSNSSNPKRILFIDLQNHWSRLFVEGLLLRPSLNAALVYPDSTSQFQPDRPITRAELANLLEIAFANRNVPRITSRLNDLATKAEVLVAISRQLGLNNKAHTTPQTYLLSMYRDALKVPDYAIPAIATLTQQGLVTNYPDPRILAPTTPIRTTRSGLLAIVSL